MKEIEEKLKTKFEVEENEIKEIIKAIGSYTKFVHLTGKIPKVVTDPKDNPVLQTAVKAKTDYLVTGDRHLLVLKKYKNVKILTPAQFLKSMVR